MRTQGSYPILFVVFDLALVACATRDVSVPDATRDVTPVPRVERGDAPVPVSCGKPREASSGDLCGRTTQPCQVQVNEVLGNNISYLGSISLALDDTGEAMAIYSTNELSHPATFLRRTGAGQWSTEKVSVPVARAALGKLGGKPYLFANDGAKHQQILRRETAGWSIVDQVAGDGGWPGGMAIDDAGCFHLRLQNQGSPSGIASYGLRHSTGAWSIHSLSAALDGGPIALGPDGTPHFAYWGRPDEYKPTFVYWVAPPGSAEPVLAGSNVIVVRGIQLAVTPSTASAAGTPYILIEHGSEGSGTLTLASRGADAKWSFRTLETAPPFETCSTPPTAPGQTCTTKYIVYRALAVISAGKPDQLRLLYARHDEQAALTSSCADGKCTWNGKNVITGAIILAAVDDAQVEKSTLLDTFIAERASTAVAAQGRIHVLLTGASVPPTTLDSEIRYLQLAPKL